MTCTLEEPTVLSLDARRLKYKAAYARARRDLNDYGTPIDYASLPEDPDYKEPPAKEILYMTKCMLLTGFSEDDCFNWAIINGVRNRLRAVDLIPNTRTHMVRWETDEIDVEGTERLARSAGYPFKD